MTVTMDTSRCLLDKWKKTQQKEYTSRQEYTSWLLCVFKINISWVWNNWKTVVALDLGTFPLSVEMKTLWLLCFQQEMAVWMSEDTFYLQERALVIIARVLSFASRRAKGFVSHRGLCGHSLPKTAFLYFFTKATSYWHMVLQVTFFTERYVLKIFS